MFVVHALDFDLSKASMLQGVVAVGVALGAILAARLVSLRDSVKVIPMGIAMGLIVMVMTVVHDVNVAMVLLMLIGGCAGFFVVPMNALLQHRGHILMGAGHSIAVQNFNENLSILAMTGVYALLIAFDLSVDAVIVAFGLFVAGTMLVIKHLHEANQRQFDSVALLDELKH